MRAIRRLLILPILLGLLLQGVASQRPATAGGDHAAYPDWVLASLCLAEPGDHPATPSDLSGHSHCALCQAPLPLLAAGPAIPLPAALVQAATPPPPAPLVGHAPRAAYPRGPPATA
ncbi:MAG: hypothetical protein OHK0024_04400 [Thalassobaculales bacterium]